MTMPAIFPELNFVVVELNDAENECDLVCDVVFEIEWIEGVNEPDCELEGGSVVPETDCKLEGSCVMPEPVCDPNGDAVELIENAPVGKRELAAMDPDRVLPSDGVIESVEGDCVVDTGSDVLTLPEEFPDTDPDADGPTLLEEFPDTDPDADGLTLLEEFPDTDSDPEEDSEVLDDDDFVFDAVFELDSVNIVGVSVLVIDIVGVTVEVNVPVSVNC